MANFVVDERQIAGETVYGIKDSNGERVSTRYTTWGVRRDLEDLEYAARQDEKNREKDLDDLNKIKERIAEEVFSKSLEEFEAMQEEKHLQELAQKRLETIKGCNLSNEEMDELLDECAEKNGEQRLSGAFLEEPEETRDRLARELTGKLSVCDFSELSDEEKEEDPLYQFSLLVEEFEAEFEAENEEEGALDADIL